MSRLRIAIVESPNPIDLFEGRSETQALAASCRLMGHQVASFAVKSHREFCETIDYLACADSVHAEEHEKLPLILHVSCHGNSRGIAIGEKSVNWGQLVKDILPLIGNPKYKGPLTLSLSSCNSGANKLSAFIAGKDGDATSKKFPEYIFSIHGETVSWDDALIAWTLLHWKLAAVGLKDRKAVLTALKQIRNGTDVVFNYSRWDSELKKYLHMKATDG